MFFPEGDQHGRAKGVARVVRLFSAAARQDKPMSDTPIALTKPATPSVASKKAVPKRHDFGNTLRVMRGSLRSGDE